MKTIIIILVLIICSVCWAGNISNNQNSGFTPYTTNTKISEVINDPVFGEYGKLIFPVNNWYYSGNTLGDLSLTWYSNIRPDKTVEIANYFKSHVLAGEKIFYDIYSDDEKKIDPAKKNTGLFFFKGKKGAEFAICNAGGGFAFVGGHKAQER